MSGSWVPHHREAYQRMPMTISRSVYLPSMWAFSLLSFSRLLLASATSHTEKVASWISTIQTNASLYTNHYRAGHSPSITRCIFFLCITGRCCRCRNYWRLTRFTSILHSFKTKLLKAHQIYTAILHSFKTKPLKAHQIHIHSPFL